MAPGNQKNAGTDISSELVSIKIEQRRRKQVIGTGRKEEKRKLLIVQLMAAVANCRYCPVQKQKYALIILKLLSQTKNQ